MCDYHALGFGCCPGSEDDFRDIFAVERNGSVRRFAGPVFDFRYQPDRHAGFNFAVKGGHAIAAQNQLWLDFLPNPLKQAQRGLRIDWYKRDAFEDAAPQRRDPPRAAFGRYHYHLAFSNARRSKPASEALRDPRNVAIRPGPSAIAVIVDDELAGYFRNPPEESR